MFTTIFVRSQRISPVSLGASALLFIIASACGGPPADNPLLLEARTAYNKAATDRAVLVNAQVELEEAQAELEQAEMLWRAKKDKVLVDHHAYMAKQRSKIAIETAKLTTADEEVQRADLERKQVQLEARSVEAERAAAIAEQRRAEAEKERQLADQARRQAESARDEAERARREADNAMATMQEMTAKLAEMEARQTERGLVLTLGDVLFDVGKSTLKSGGDRAVAQLAEFMFEYPERRVLVEGYTDSSGGEETNQRLSEQRANAVRQALLQKGIASSRIETTGYGESYPVATNGTSAGRQQNRRVEVVISDEKGVIKVRN